MAKVALPSKDKIFEYWQKHYKKLGPVNNNDDDGIRKNECFACGNIFKGIERAHIIPQQDGGPNTVYNIHLLCSSCHKESEGLKNYWEWLHYKRCYEWHYPRYYFEKMCRINNIDLKSKIEEWLINNDDSEDSKKRFMDEIFKVIL